MSTLDSILAGSGLTAGARTLASGPEPASALAKVLAPAVKPEPAKIESKVDIQAPFSLVVNGDVKDAATLYAQLRPLLDQHQRDLGKQLESRKLYDEPHV